MIFHNGMQVVNILGSVVADIPSYFRRGQDKVFSVELNCMFILSKEENNLLKYFFFKIASGYLPFTRENYYSFDISPWNDAASCQQLREQLIIILYSCS